jgi:hypothetical protein
MAGDIYDLIDPAILTEVARLALADEDRPSNALVLERWFPNTATPNLEWETTGRTTRTFTQAMPFRAFTTGAPFGSRPGRVRKSGQLPPMSLQFLLTELDRIRQREAIATGGSAAEAVQGDVFNDISAGIRALRARMEIVRADLLMTGAASIAENGLSLTVDFGRDPTRASTVTTVWSDVANCVPLTDETAVMNLMSDEEGLGPDDMVAMFSRQTWLEWKASAQVRNAFNSVRVLSVVPDSELTQMRRDLDLPEAIIYNAQVRNTAGNARRVITDGKVVYVPRNSVVGQTQFGVPAIADEPEMMLELDDRPGPVAYMKREVGPPMNIFTVIDAIGFPVFADPDATYCLTV